MAAHDTSVPPTVPIWFDVISPYAYLAWVTLRRWEAEGRVRTEPMPVLFAGLLEAHGTLGPAEVPAKRRYVFLDALRKADRLGIELAAPCAHPFNPLPLLRAALAAAEERRRPLVDALFRAVWVEARDVRDPGTVRAAAASAGLAEGEIDALEEQIADPGVKDLLRQRTREAVELGIFGVPSMRFADQLFWGVDSLDDLERARTRGPVVPDGEAWSRVRPQAVRRRAPG